MSNNRFILKIYKNSTIKRIQNKIKLLGININEISFLNYRLVISALIFIGGIFLFKYGYIYGPILGVMSYYGIEYIYFDLRIKKRIDRLNNEALFYFEVLALTLESGKNLKGAIELTCNSVKGELSNEFKQALHEVKLGKSLTESLEDMKKRIPSESINNVILNITQSDIFGNSIVESLYNQIDFLRQKKLNDTKARINKLPVKISVISVLFFIPLMLLIILSPILIDLLLG